MENTTEPISKRGAVELFKALREENSVKLGIATGGWGHTARMKLAHAGIELADEPLVSSDDSAERIEIMRLCLSRLGENFDKIIYFGDAQWDLECTQTLGWQFVGVRQGLKGKCDLWIQDYSDTKAVMDVILKPVN